MPKGKVRYELDQAEKCLMRALMEAVRCSPNAVKDIQKALECVVSARVWIQKQKEDKP